MKGHHLLTSVCVCALAIARPARAAGIPAPDTLVLPQFQVHGLFCGDGWIDVAAYDVMYRIVLDSASRPQRYERRPLPPGGVASEYRPFPTRNLGTLIGAQAYRAPIGVPLARLRSADSLRLEIVATVVPPKLKRLLTVSSRLVVRSAQALLAGVSLR